MDRQYTYVASDNTSSNGTALGDDNQDIAIYQIIIGNPADGKYVEIYNKINPVAGATSDVVMKLTVPTAAEGKNYQQVYDFGEQGVQIGEGGNVVTDATDVTVVWGVV